MARFKVMLDRPECIGCGNCAAACPEYWEMANDGYSHLIGSYNDGDSEVRDLDDESCNRAAAEACPATCIHIEEGGRRVL